MHKLRTYLIFCFISLVFIVGQFIWHINMPYTLAGFRVSTDMENYKFNVTDCFPSGPAHKAGLRVGDTIVRINDLDVHEFTLKYADSFEDSYKNYSKLYQFDVPYEMECENGFVCRFTIKNDMPFLDRLGCICIDNWTTFITGLLFVLFSIITSIFATNIEGTSDFIWFMLAMGPCIVNGYTEAANTLAYTVVAFISFDIATALSSFSIFRSVGYFFRLAGKENIYKSLRSLSLIPIFISAVKFLLVATGVLSIFNEFLVYMPMLILGLSFLFQFVMFIVLMRKIKQQPSILLRFFFLGLCFSTMVPAFTLVLHVVQNAFWVADEYETLYTILPLNFIPFAVFCALFQTSSINLDNITGKLMNGGCTMIIVSTLTVFINGTAPLLIVLSCLMVITYILLEKPIVSFLFPKIEYVQAKLDGLEKDVFKCNTTRDILVTASDWLHSMINMGFMAICMFSDNKTNLNNVVFSSGLLSEEQNAMLNVMVKERENYKGLPETILIHKKNGFSVPYYRFHKLAGYLFVAQKSRYSIFSNTEIRLVPPVARIIMESSMVIELNRQSLLVNEMQRRIVYSFADMIESRDGMTGQHVKRTSQIVVLIMSKLRDKSVYDSELDDDDYEMIAMAAPLHDIGKIKVPDAILSKPGKLTEEEFDLIKTHPVEGEKIISKTMGKIENDKYLKFAKDMALYHHEKWNGTGYPYGLSGPEIPLCARIMAVADVFDALCSKRSYKDAYSIDKAFQIFEESKGSHFEPCLVELLYELRSDLENMYATT